MSIFKQILSVAWIPILTLGLSPLGAEVAFRMLGIETVDEFKGPYEPLGADNFKLQENVSTIITQFPNSFDLHTDALGFRKSLKSPGVSHDNKQIDILMIGDSQTFGWGMNYSQSLPGLFQKKAELANLRVANSAVGAHYIRNQVDLIRHLTMEEDLRPRVFLACLTGRATQGGLMKVYVQDNGLIFWFKPGRLTLLKTWVASYSAAYLVARNAYYNLKGSYAPTNLRQRSAAPPLEEFLDSELTAALGELQEIANRSNATIITCYFPYVTEEDIQSNIFLDNSGRKLKASAEELQIPFIDVSPAIKAAFEKGEPLTLKNDGHYSAAVSGEIAELLWNAVDWVSLAKNATKESAP